MWNEYYSVKITIWLIISLICLVLYKNLALKRTYSGYGYFVILGLLGPFVSPDCMCTSIPESIMIDTTVAVVIFSVSTVVFLMAKKIKKR